MTRSSSLPTRHCSKEPRTRKYVKGYGILSFARNLSNKYGKKLLDTVTKKRLDALKTASKKVVRKAAEATEKFKGNKITDRIAKLAENSRSVEEIVIPPEVREEILNELRQIL